MDPNEMQTTVMHHLLDRVKTGDETAFNTLLKNLAAPLELIARRMLKRFPRIARWSDPEDVLQNASLRLMRALRDVRPGSMREMYAFATTLMRRELLDMAKSFYGKQGIGANHASVGAKADDLSPTPTRSTEEDSDFEKWVAFHEEMEKLPVEEREVIGLAFYHGLNQAEIAEVFQVSERTVQRRWQSAVARLKSTVGDWSTL
jgi:RNA polymerase sigma factor (sigma-70 family)